MCRTNLGPTPTARAAVQSRFDSPLAETRRIRSISVRTDRRPGRRSVPRDDPVRAAPVAGGDVRLPYDFGAEHVPEQLELRVAGGPLSAGDVENGAVVLAQPDRAIAAEHGVCQVALLVLDDGELPDTVRESRGRAHPIVEL